MQLICTPNRKTNMKETAFKYFEGRATDDELEKLLDWLRKRENHLIFHNFRLDWRKSLKANEFPGGSAESWYHFQTTLEQKSYLRWQKSRRIMKFYRVAAIFLFVFTVGSLLWYYSNQPADIPETFTRVITENGQISKVELPDGSLVWLNSGSKLSYNNFFSSKNREVSLLGEAYFDVKKNEALPMLVNCNGLQVKVLGTQFNVNAYEPETSVDVVLENGSVELFNTSYERVLYRMKPGEMAKVSLKKNQVLTNRVNVVRYTSWKDGIINIYDLSIDDLIKRLEKRYNQQFEVAPGTKHLRYTFTIENEPLENVLTLMERITPIKVVQKDEIIKIDIDKRKLREAGS